MAWLLGEGARRRYKFPFAPLAWNRSPTWVPICPTSFKSRLVLALSGALVFLVFVSVLSYRRILQEDADQKWIEHTHLVLEKLGWSPN